MALFWWLVCVFRNVCWEHALQVFSVGSGGEASWMGKSLKSSLGKTCGAPSFFIPTFPSLLCGRMVLLCHWWKVRAHMVPFQILSYPSFVRATWERSWCSYCYFYLLKYLRFSKNHLMFHLWIMNLGQENKEKVKCIHLSSVSQRDACLLWNKTDPWDNIL